MSSAFTLESHTEEQTCAFGRFLGTQLRSAVTILLQGDLGVGKSVVARALARGLGVPEEVPVTSPTFTLMNHYLARLDLYHFDLYRLADAEELLEIGFDDFAHCAGVALIEWPERLDDRSFDHLLIEIDRVSATQRCIKVSAQGESLSALVEGLKQWSSAE